jgi:hypothetical protein
MLNANPTLAPEEASAQLHDLKKQGFGSIRFNPYLWPDNEKVRWGSLVKVGSLYVFTLSLPQMDNPTGRAMFRTAGSLGKRGSSPSQTSFSSRSHPQVLSCGWVHLVAMQACQWVSCVSRG